MSVGTVSAWKQMQNWYRYQGAVTNYIYGSANSSTQTDYSSAFTNIIANNFSSQATLTGLEALNRLQNQVQAQSNKSSTSKQSPVLTAAGKSAAIANVASQGEAILSSLLGTGSSSTTSSGSSSSGSSSSQSYSAPINPVTGYPYVASSGSTLASLATVNFFV